MPKVSELPINLRPFSFHGVELIEREGQTNAIGTCPFCNKELKFHVNQETGLWDCKVCGLKGNPLSFIRQFHEKCLEATTEEDYQELAQDRKLLYTETLRKWGVCLSILTNQWLAPAYDYQCRLHQLYRYATVMDKGKKVKRLIPTPGLHPDGKVHGMFGGNLYKQDKEDAYLCEGLWDAMMLWETMEYSKLEDVTDKGERLLAVTGSYTASMLKDSNVLGTPGCNVFLETWTTFFTNKSTAIIYDNDHPKKLEDGTTREPASWVGMKRTTDILALSAHEEQPSELTIVYWGTGEKVINHNPSLPSGYDIRDYISSQDNKRESVTQINRTKLLGNLIDRLGVIPGDWLEGRSERAKNKGELTLQSIPCEDWRTLTDQFRKAMKWIDGLDKFLSVALASITSVLMPGDQLWIKGIGPASCGKSTICEALAVNTQYTFSKSAIRGFHSGISDKEGKVDNSLIPKIKGKTLITKDGDTLLQSPNLSQILSEGRDLYDKVSRVHYRTGLDRNYVNVPMTWLLCGTESLRTIDSSELGERFLDCMIMEDIDDELEDEIGKRAQNRVLGNKHIEANGQPETHQDIEMTKAMQLTGGYIDYLRKNAAQLLSVVNMSETAKGKCRALGKFIAHMRARPSTKQKESVSREMSTRLIIQLTRLAVCLAVVMNRKTVDSKILARVCSVAMDTSRGKTLQIIKALYAEKQRGLELPQIAAATNEPETGEKQLLFFLRKIRCVEGFHPMDKRNPEKKNGRYRWRLTERMMNLYQEVIEPLQ